MKVEGDQFDIVLTDTSDRHGDYEKLATVEELGVRVSGMIERFCDGKLILCSGKPGQQVHVPSE